MDVKDLKDKSGTKYDVAIEQARKYYIDAGLVKEIIVKRNIFTPFLGVDEIRFGMSREEIRKLSKSGFYCFRRNEYSINTTDFFQELGFFVEYDEDNNCEAIEFTNRSNLYENGNNLFDFTFSDLIKFCDQKSNKNLKENGIGATYYDLGLSFTKNIHSDRIESILIFSRSYWGSVLQ